MASRLFDFSHLTPDERIEPAEQLWDSLPIESIVPDGLGYEFTHAVRSTLELIESNPEQYPSRLMTSAKRRSGDVLFAVYSWA